MRVVSLAQRALIRCLALALIGQYAHADATLRHFDIQSQVAALALKEFARQADISLVFSSTVVANRQTSGVHGDFTVAEGLRRLLDGTGLSFKQVSANAIAINVTDAASDPDPPAEAPAGGRKPAGDEPQSKGNTNMSHRGFFARLASALALSGAALAGNHAYGQDAAANNAATADASAANTSNLEEVVVTGTATAGGLKKLDASFQITTASLEEIRDAQPSSAADLLKIVPGVWAESSGGEAGANIELAGFPSGGDAPYVTYQLNGSPIYPVSTLSFLDNSSQFRIDESVERVEALLGGPGV